MEKLEQTTNEAPRTPLETANTPTASGAAAGNRETNGNMDDNGGTNSTNTATPTAGNTPAKSNPQHTDELANNEVTDMDI